MDANTSINSDRVDTASGEAAAPARAAAWLGGSRLNVRVAREMLDYDGASYPDTGRRLIEMLQAEFGHAAILAAALALCHDILNEPRSRVRAARFLWFVEEGAAGLAQEKLHPSQLARMQDLVAAAKGRASAPASG